MECGLTTAHEQTQFRATHDIRRRDDEGTKSSTSQAKFPPDMVFGISTRSVIIPLTICMITVTVCVLFQAIHSSVRPAGASLWGEVAGGEERGRAKTETEKQQKG